MDDTTARDETQDVYAAERACSITLNTLKYAVRYRLSEFTGAELKVFICLLSHANNKTKRAWVGLGAVLRETGLSQCGIKLAIAGLKRKGWIKRFQVRHATTHQRMTATTFCKWAPPVPGTLWARIESRVQRG
ncbi:MAG TPA: hypothetical protein VNW47_09445 [Terriglobales bacterium]|nr:hypothetical protein [Terriglobales bacterium]